MSLIESTPVSRRRLVLSLRALMVAVLVVGGFLGWLMHQARVKRNAVAAIDRSGGRAFYDWQLGPVGNLATNPRSPGPRWLVDPVGAEFFGDADVGALEPLTNLVSLRIRGSRLTDAGMARLSGLTRLTLLDVSSAPITAAGLKALGKLDRRSRLFLDETKVDDLTPLAQLPSLSMVVLGKTPLTDAGLASAVELRSLTGLILRETAISDAGLAHLANVTTLTSLNLSGTKITDAGLAQLANLPRLRSLILTSTAVTDAGLVALARMRSLQTVNLKGTRTTDAAVAELKKSRPNLDLQSPPGLGANPR
jgi:hypothetical protein